MRNKGASVKENNNFTVQIVEGKDCCLSASLELLHAIRLTVSDPLMDFVLDNELQNLRRLLAFVE